MGGHRRGLVKSTTATTHLINPRFNAPNSRHLVCGVPWHKKGLWKHDPAPPPTPNQSPSTASMCNPMCQSMYQSQSMCPFNVSSVTGIWALGPR